MVFKPGQSGNKSGRPKSAAELARPSRAMAVETLAEIAGDRAADALARVNASIALLAVADKKTAAA